MAQGSSLQDGGVAEEMLGATTIYMTHDQIEAMTLGNRVAVLKDGELQQADRPSVFDAPVNLLSPPSSGRRP